MTRINLLVYVLLLPSYVSSFVIPSPSFGSEIVRGSPGCFQMGSESSGSIGYSSSTSLFAQKKKRRRRKDIPSQSPSAPSAPMPITDNDELPDFDLVEDVDLELKSKQDSGSNAGVGTAPSATSLDTSDPEIMAVMRTTMTPNGAPLPSTKDLLRSRNRALEDKLVVNEVKEAVPSLGEYMSSPNRRGSAEAGSGIGKKAAKREARRAAAMEAEQAGVEEESLFDKLPFFKKKENEEKKSPIKLLEEGTWACIYTLVAWEVYINSPLFERAAPLAPVVFTDPVTMTFLL